MDRISRLPIDIIESILCLIPIQEAARTSILSKEWRHRWLKIPKLVFIQDIIQDSTSDVYGVDLAFDQPSEREEMTSRCKLLYSIFQVLLMHQGPIYEFTLRMYGSCVEIDHILLHLLKKNTVKKLKLDLSGSYKLPPSFFSLHQLTDLYLNGCVIDHLPSSTGFSSLTTLKLRHLWLTKNLHRRFLSSFPLVKRLTVYSESSMIDVDGNSKIAELMECLPVIEYLSIWFPVYWSPLPTKVSTTLVHLKYLCVECIPFGHIYSLPFLVLLIRSAPNLEKLKLEVDEVHMYDAERFLGSPNLKGYSDISLEHLSELEILNFSDLENILAFVKLILAKSPVLKKVRILLWYELDKGAKVPVSKELFSFPCASPWVKFIVI